MVGLLVCQTFSMVTTSKVTGLEKTLFTLTDFFQKLSKLCTLWQSLANKAWETNNDTGSDKRF